MKLQVPPLYLQNTETKKIQIPHITNLFVNVTYQLLLSLPKLTSMIFSASTLSLPQLKSAYAEVRRKGVIFSRIS